MPKFTLTAEHAQNADGKVIYEFEKVSLPDILESFELFLKGVGFVFEGHIEIINDDIEESL